MRVAIVHDYLTQRGGAERVVVAMSRAFPDAPIHTTLYDPSTTFREIDPARIRTSVLDRLPPLRRHHRLALPLLAPTVSHMRVDADVALCSSSGWSHGVAASGAKVVYCHTPARWLYHGDAYLRTRGLLTRTIAATLHGPLVRWDREAAGSADRYVVNSNHIARRVEEVYGVRAAVLPPPPGILPEGPMWPVAGLEPGFVLCVSRLLPYKNVDVVVRAFRALPGTRLVVVGDGPDRSRVAALAGDNVHLVDHVDDASLRWLYASSAALVAASYEDFGLTPIEAAAFGRPVAALRYGGFLDTLVEGETGVFFDRPQEEDVVEAVTEVVDRRWDEVALRDHAAGFSESVFAARLRAIVAEAAGARADG